MPQVDRKTPPREHVQTIIFSKKDGWTESRCKQWLKAHNKFTDGFHETDNHFRYRQYNTDHTKFDYVTVSHKSDAGVKLIQAYPKGKLKQSKECLDFPSVF